MDVFIGLSSEASAETLDCCLNTCEVFSVVVMTTRCFMGCLRLLLASALRSSSGSASRRRRHDSPWRDVTCFLVSWWRHLSDRSFSLPLCSSTNQVVRFQSYLKTSLIKIFYWLFSCNMILLYYCFISVYQSSSGCCRFWANFMVFLWSLSTNLRNMCVHLSSSETLTDWYNKRWL